MRTVLRAITLCLLATAATCNAFSGNRNNTGDDILRQPMPDRWIYTGIDTGTIPEDNRWWRTFGDPVLASIISLGIERNLDLAQAARRMDIARLALAGTRSAYYPTLSADASYQRSRKSGVSANGFSLGADLSWEIDLFGKISSRVKAGKASCDVSRAEYRGAMVSLVAQIARSYMDYRVLQAQLEVARMHLNSQKRVLKISQARYDAGLVSKLDVQQAKVVYGNTEASIPAIEASMQQTLDALAILLGEYPGQLNLAPGDASNLPTARRIIPAGIPLDLLRRRPDIAQAEAQIAVYAAQTGIAKKDFLPTLTLDGSIGVSSGDIDNLFDSNSFSYSIGPTLSWTIFEGLGRKYAVEKARVQVEAAIDSYNLTVMTAIGEVNNAMSAYSAALRTIALQRDVLDNSQEAFNLSLDQYRQGLTSFTNVENAQISWLNCANSLVASQGKALDALIDIYKALGGSPID